MFAAVGACRDEVRRGGRVGFPPMFVAMGARFNVLSRFNAAHLRVDLH